MSRSEYPTQTAGERGEHRARTPRRQNLAPTDDRGVSIVYIYLYTIYSAIVIIINIRNILIIHSDASENGMLYIYMHTSAESASITLLSSCITFPSDVATTKSGTKNSSIVSWPGTAGASRGFCPALNDIEVITPCAMSSNQATTRNWKSKNRTAPSSQPHTINLSNIVSRRFIPHLTILILKKQQQTI